MIEGHASQVELFNSSPKRCDNVCLVITSDNMTHNLWPNTRQDNTLGLITHRVLWSKVLTEVRNIVVTKYAGTEDIGNRYTHSIPTWMAELNKSPALERIRHSVPCMNLSRGKEDTCQDENKHMHIKSQTVVISVFYVVLWKWIVGF